MISIFEIFFFAFFTRQFETSALLIYEKLIDIFQLKAEEKEKQKQKKQREREAKRQEKERAIQIRKAQQMSRKAFQPKECLKVRGDNFFNLLFSLNTV